MKRKIVFEKKVFPLKDFFKKVFAFLKDNKTGFNDYNQYKKIILILL